MNRWEFHVRVVIACWGPKNDVPRCAQHAVRGRSKDGANARPQVLGLNWLMDPMVMFDTFIDACQEWFRGVQVHSLILKELVHSLAKKEIWNSKIHWVLVQLIL